MSPGVTDSDISYINEIHEIRKEMLSIQREYAKARADERHEDAEILEHQVRDKVRFYPKSNVIVS